MSYTVLEINAENTRFDFTAMVQEWSDFTQSQCGYESLDPMIVEVMVRIHHEIFRELLKEHDLRWNDLEGSFYIRTDILAALGGVPPLSLTELDILWSNAFGDAEELMETIEGDLFEEQQLGLA